MSTSVLHRRHSSRRCKFSDRKFFFREIVLMLIIVLLFPSLLTEATEDYVTYDVSQLCASKTKVSLILAPRGEGSALILKLSPGPLYLTGIDCNITFLTSTSSKGNGLIFDLRSVGLRRDNATCVDAIQFFGKGGSELLGTECGRYTYPAGQTFYVADDLNSPGGVVLSVKTAGACCPTIADVGFHMAVTVYERSYFMSCPNEDDFRCLYARERCIWSHLRCDSWNNCGDNSDESMCGKWFSLTNQILIFFVAVISAVTLIAVIMCLMSRRRA